MAISLGIYYFADYREYNGKTAREWSKEYSEQIIDELMEASNNGSVQQLEQGG